MRCAARLGKTAPTPEHVCDGKAFLCLTGALLQDDGGSASAVVIAQQSTDGRAWALLSAMRRSPSDGERRRQPPPTANRGTPLSLAASTSPAGRRSSRSWLIAAKGRRALPTLHCLGPMRPPQRRR